MPASCAHTTPCARPTSAKVQRRDSRHRSSARTLCCSLAAVTDDPDQPLFAGHGGARATSSAVCAKWRGRQGCGRPRTHCGTHSRACSSKTGAASPTCTTNSGHSTPEITYGIYAHLFDLAGESPGSHEKNWTMPGRRCPKREKHVGKRRVLSDRGVRRRTGSLGAGGATPAPGADRRVGLIEGPGD
jgi:hypothetical protein